MFRKCLFHIHTPASHDFYLHAKQKSMDKEKMSEEYKKMSESEVFALARNEGLFPAGVGASSHDFPLDDLFSDKKEYFAYLLIAHKLFQNKIEIAVVRCTAINR
jgi:hypothetical protein